MHRHRNRVHCRTLSQRLAYVLLLAATLFYAGGRVTAAEVQPQDALLSEYSYPYPVRYYKFDAQQQPLRMAYMDIAAQSSPAKGTVFLLHGKNFSGAYWQETIAALTRQGYRVIAPDQIGFGKSAKPAQFQFSFQALADHTRSLLENLGVDKVYVAGHSMGGMLATRFALMFPEKVKKLVLINPIGLEDWKRHVPYQTLDEAIAQEKLQTPEMVKTYMTRAYFDGKWKPEYDPLLDIQAGWAIGPDAGAIASIDARTSDMVFTQPVVYEFSDLRTPTLLIIGTRDKTAIGRNRAPASVQAQLGRYDRLGKQTAEKIPGAKLVELEGIGHVPQFEAFDPYMAAFSQFLSE